MICTPNWILHLEKWLHLIIPWLTIGRCLLGSFNDDSTKKFPIEAYENQQLMIVQSTPTFF
jgi:hypothetical protein